MPDTSEFALVSRAVDRLRSHDSVTVCRDLPALGRCVDLAYLAGATLFTIEFKLHDWQRAIRQAKDHRLVADYAYVCMPRRELTSVMEEAFREAGVGLFFWNDLGSWPFEVAVPAARSFEQWSKARLDALEYVRLAGCSPRG